MEATELLKLISTVVDMDSGFQKTANEQPGDFHEEAIKIAEVLDGLSRMVKSAEPGVGSTALPVSVAGPMSGRGAHVNMGSTVNKQDRPSVGRLLSPVDAANAMMTDAENPPKGMPVKPTKGFPIKSGLLKSEPVEPYTPKGGVVPATAKEVADFTKADAKAPEKAYMKQLLDEPMQSSSTDSTLDTVLNDTEGAKVASDPIEEAKAIINSITEGL
jgi:hypothetical protein